MAQHQPLLAELLGTDTDAVLQEWLHEVAGSGGAASTAGSQAEARQLLDALVKGLRAGADPQDLDQPGWDPRRGACFADLADREPRGAAAWDPRRPRRQAGATVTV